MSSIIDEDPELSMNVKYSKGEDRGERLEGLVLLHENVDSCTDRQVHVSTQDGEIKAQKKLPAVKRSRFRAVEVKLVVLYLLILAGITTRYILVSLEKEQLKDEMEEKCPDRWTRFGSSCYFKSTEAKHWQESRRACQDKGADLVMINSKEEQVGVFVHVCVIFDGADSELQSSSYCELKPHIDDKYTCANIQTHKQSSTFIPSETQQLETMEENKGEKIEGELTCKNEFQPLTVS
ncbi:uncharacterized protein LOC143412306 isoform X1 [Maylandia zebra]|uniref:uncharacterized protein LOC143412306 isoform X1 n=1 Tax=Maylandia zebra TaxID=106582 RepID=UPI00403C9AC6